MAGRLGGNEMYFLNNKNTFTCNEGKQQTAVILHFSRLSGKAGGWEYRKTGRVNGRLIRHAFVYPLTSIPIDDDEVVLIVYFQKSIERRCNRGFFPSLFYLARVDKVQITTILTIRHGNFILSFPFHYRAFHASLGNGKMFCCIQYYSCKWLGAWRQPTLQHRLLNNGIALFVADGLGKQPGTREVVSKNGDS